MEKKNIARIICCETWVNSVKHLEQKTEYTLAVIVISVIVTRWRVSFRRQQRLHRVKWGCALKGSVAGEPKVSGSLGLLHGDWASRCCAEDGYPLVLSLCESGCFCIGRKLRVANCIVIRWGEMQGCFVFHLSHEWCFFPDPWFHFSPEDTVSPGRVSAPWKTKRKSFVLKCTDILRLQWTWVLFSLLEDLAFSFIIQMDWEEGRLVGPSTDVGCAWWKDGLTVLSVQCAWKAATEQLVRYRSFLACPGVLLWK